VSRDLSLYLDDIISSIDKILDYTASMTQEIFVNEDRTFEATVFNLQIIGEASKQIPDEYRNRYPEIPWKEVVGLRNIIVHTYFRLSNDVIWNIIQNELTELRRCIVLIKAESNKK
jgi:uncharacterized protein with HEPN domain